MSDAFSFLTENVHVYRTATTPKEITTAAWRVIMNAQNLSLRFVRGAKMETVGELFDEFAAAFQFPYYFGENWAAFDECIADLEWIESDIYITVITTASKLLANESLDQLDVFFKYVDKAAVEFAAQNKTFFVILQDAPGVRIRDLRYLGNTVTPVLDIDISKHW